MNATIDETNPIPTEAGHHQPFSRYPCWPTYNVRGLWPWRIRGRELPSHLISVFYTPRVTALRYVCARPTRVSSYVSGSGSARAASTH